MDKMALLGGANSAQQSVKQTSSQPLEMLYIHNFYRLEEALKKEKLLMAKYKNGSVSMNNFIAANCVCIEIQNSKLGEQHPVTAEMFLQLNLKTDLIFIEVIETEKHGNLYVLTPFGYKISDYEIYQKLKKENSGAVKTAAEKESKIHWSFINPIEEIDIRGKEFQISYNPGISYLQAINYSEEIMVDGINGKQIDEDYHIEEGFKDPIIEEINSRYMVACVNGKTQIIKEETDPIDSSKVILPSTIADMKLWWANQSIMDNGIPVNIVDYWSRHEKRRQYKNVVFAPGMPPSEEYYNSWQGFEMEDQKGDRDCSLFLKHLLENIASGDPEIEKYILDWLADIIQRPEKKPEVAIVLQGGQGVGKSVFVKTFGRLLGRHYIMADNPTAYAGQFNMLLKECLLLFADEAHSLKDTKAESSLKTLISEDTRIIEGKGRDSIQARNYARVIIASNYQNVVPAGVDDRRYFIINTGDGKKQDREFFAAMVGDMDNGGCRYCLNLLRNRNIDGVDLSKFPITEAKIDNMLANLTPLEKWWFNKLDKGYTFNDDDEYKWHQKIMTKRLFNDYLQIDTSIEDGVFGKGLRKLIPGATAQRMKFDDGGRHPGYVFPSLEDCRKQFERYAKIDKLEGFKWSDISDEDDSEDQTEQ
jgi:hypothetical protein